MLHRHSVRRSIFTMAALCSLGASSAACGSDDTSTTEPSSSIAGSYRATTLQVTPTGLPVIDVLALGGTLSMVIAADNTTTGTLSLPAGVGGSAVSASLTGKAVQTGTTVRFQQTSDTFMRDLPFTVSGTTLQATNQVAGAGAFTIVLTRQ